MAGDNVCTKNKLYKNMKKMCVPALAIAVSESYDFGECTAASGHPFDSSAGSGCVMRGIWQITGCSSWNPDLNLPGFSESDGNPPVVTHAKAIYLNLTSNDPNWGCNGDPSKENTPTIQGIQQKQSPQYGATGHRFCAGTCACTCILFTRPRTPSLPPRCTRDRRVIPGERRGKGRGGVQDPQEGMQTGTAALAAGLMLNVQ